MRQRKFKKPRRPHRLFLVICEGETEKAYVELLKRHYRLPIVIRTIVCGNTINARLLNQYLKELEVDKEDEYQVFYIYDSDVKEVVEKLLSLPGILILTNPCIELWYLLHSANHTSKQSSETIVRLLKRSHPDWTNYEKAILTTAQTKILLSNTDNAVMRASKLLWPGNPSSNVYVFIHALDKERSNI